MSLECIEILIIFVLDHLELTLGCSGVDMVVHKLWTQESMQEVQEFEILMSYRANVFQNKEENIKYFRNCRSFSLLKYTNVQRIKWKTMCCLLVNYMNVKSLALARWQLWIECFCALSRFHDISCYIFILPFTIFNNGDENVVPLMFYQNSLNVENCYQNIL